MAKAKKPLPSLDFLLPRIKLSRALAALGYVGLIGTLLVYNVFFAELHGANPAVILMVMLVPLLIFIPGIIKASPRAHAFLCFVMNLYFIYGVLTCFRPGRELYGTSVVMFSLLYFIAALGFIRWTFQADRVRKGEV